MKKVLPIVAFLTSISAMAKTSYPQILQQDPEGPEAPPGVPIDSYLIFMFSFAIFLAIIFFIRNKRREVSGL